MLSNSAIHRVHGNLALYMSKIQMSFKCLSVLTKFEPCVIIFVDELCAHVYHWCIQFLTDWLLFVVLMVFCHYLILLVLDATKCLHFLDLKYQMPGGIAHFGQSKHGPVFSLSALKSSRSHLDICKARKCGVASYFKKVQFLKRCFEERVATRFRQ